MASSQSDKHLKEDSGYNFKLTLRILLKRKNLMEDVAMFGLILWDSQHSSAVVKMLLSRRNVGCLLCLLLSAVFGYRPNFEGTYSAKFGRCQLEGLQCVDLPQCPPIAREAYRSSSRPFLLQKLNVYRCGLRHGIHQVCCPIDSVIQPTPKPRVTGTRPDTSIVRHRNFKLINRHCGVGLTNRIAGGQNALPGEFPWLAALQYNVSGELKYLCGGSLITDMYVLTAAHCIAPTFNSPSLKLVGLRLGEYDFASDADCVLDNITVRCPGSTRDYAPSQLVIHSGFNRQDRKEFRNDIALVRLQTRAQLSEYVNPVCLPVPSRITTKNGLLFTVNLTVAGWGMTKNSMESNVLMKVGVPYKDPEMCSYSLRGRTVLPGQLCAGGMPAMNACNGDSGGPLIASILSSGGTRICYQVGIVSIGFGSCLSSNPSIYTNVEDFLPWILDHIRD